MVGVFCNWFIKSYSLLGRWGGEGGMGWEGGNQVETLGLGWRLLLVWYVWAIEPWLLKDSKESIDLPLIVMWGQPLIVKKGAG